MIKKAMEKVVRLTAVCALSSVLTSTLYAADIIKGGALGFAKAQTGMIEDDAIKVRCVGDSKYAKCSFDDINALGVQLSDIGFEVSLQGSEYKQVKYANLNFNLRELKDYARYLPQSIKCESVYNLKGENIKGVDTCKIEADIATLDIDISSNIASSKFRNRSLESVLGFNIAKVIEYVNRIASINENAMRESRNITAEKYAKLDELYAQRDALQERYKYAVSDSNNAVPFREARGYQTPRDSRESIESLEIIEIDEDAPFAIVRENKEIEPQSFSYSRKNDTKTMPKDKAKSGCNCGCASHSSGHSCGMANVDSKSKHKGGNESLASLLNDPLYLENELNKNNLDISQTRTKYDTQYRELLDETKEEVDSVKKDMIKWLKNYNFDIKEVRLELKASDMANYTFALYAQDFLNFNENAKLSKKEKQARINEKKRIMAGYYSSIEAMRAASITYVQESPYLNAENKKGIVKIIDKHAKLFEPHTGVKRVKILATHNIESSFNAGNAAESLISFIDNDTSLDVFLHTLFDNVNEYSIKSVRYFPN